MEDCRGTNIPVIGDAAPAFHAVTTRGELNFPIDYHGKWIIFFSYQADFTPVDTTEIMTFAVMVEELKLRNTELIGISVDSVYSHIAWIRKIKELAWKDIKHVEVSFPLVADVTMEICRKYGFRSQNGSDEYTGRTVIIIDQEGKIRANINYPVSIGRNMLEIKRILFALQKTDCENAVTPADWMPGEDIILPPPTTCQDAADRKEKISENQYCMDWFMSFRQADCTDSNQENEPEGVPFPSAYPMRRRMNNRR